LKKQRLILILGGNQGDVQEVFRKALLRINNELGEVKQRSSLYRTKAWGPVPQDDFLNFVVEIDTIFPPQTCLNKILKIEKDFGRNRAERYGPRTLDIDILYYGHKVLNQKNLKVPHPQISNRRFTLIPLNEILPGFIHPVLNKKNLELLAECKDPLEVWKV